MSSSDSDSAQPGTNKSPPPKGAAAAPTKAKAKTTGVPPPPEALFRPSPAVTRSRTCQDNRTGMPGPAQTTVGQIFLSPSRTPESPQLPALPPTTQPTPARRSIIGSVGGPTAISLKPPPPPLLVARMDALETKVDQLLEFLKTALPAASPAPQLSSALGTQPTMAAGQQGSPPTVPAMPSSKVFQPEAARAAPPAQLTATAPRPPLIQAPSRMAAALTPAAFIQPGPSLQAPTGRMPAPTAALHPPTGSQPPPAGPASPPAPASPSHPAPQAPPAGHLTLPPESLPAAPSPAPWPQSHSASPPPPQTGQPSPPGAGYLPPGRLQCPAPLLLPPSGVYQPHPVMAGFGHQGEPQFHSTFDGDDRKLPSFLVKVQCFLEIHEHLYPTERAKVHPLIMAMTGRAAQWVTTLYDFNPEALETPEAFIIALKDQYEDVDRRSSLALQLCNIKQGNRKVKAYINEFKHLAMENPDWSAPQLVQTFRKGLNLELHNRAMLGGGAHTLKDWMALASKVEADQQLWLHQWSAQEGDSRYPRWSTRRTTARDARGPPPPRPPHRPSQGECYKCGRQGHWASECRSGHPPATPSPRPPIPKPRTAPGAAPKKAPHAKLTELERPEWETLLHHTEPYMAEDDDTYGTDLAGNE